MGLEFGGLILERLAESSVVVDFTVDGEEKLLIVGSDGLSASV